MRSPTHLRQASGSSAAPLRVALSSRVSWSRLPSTWGAPPRPLPTCEEVPPAGVDFGRRFTAASFGASATSCGRCTPSPSGKFAREGGLQCQETRDGFFLARGQGRVPLASGAGGEYGKGRAPARRVLTQQCLGRRVAWRTSDFFQRTDYSAHRLLSKARFNRVQERAHSYRKAFLCGSS